MKKEIILTVYHNKDIIVHEFETITGAYTYYVKKYSSFREWLYYLFCAHKLLSSVTNEEVMECIFRNVFINGCITESYERRQRKGVV